MHTSRAPLITHGDGRTVAASPHRHWHRWARVAIGICAAACHNATGTTSVSFLRATIRPDVASMTGPISFEGSGAFYLLGPVGGVGTKDQITLLSEGTGPSFGNRFIFTWYNAGQLAVGEYAIHTPQDGELEGRHGLEAVISMHVNGIDSYASSTGILTIMRASSTRVEGRFVFRAQRYCYRNRDNTVSEGSCIPSQVDSRAARVDVSGTFVLERRTFPSSGRP